MEVRLVEEALDEAESDAARDYRPETFRYILDTLNAVRSRLGLYREMDEQDYHRQMRDWRNDSGV